MGIPLIDGKTLFPRKSRKADEPNQHLMIDRILSLSAESGLCTSLAIFQPGDSRSSDAISLDFLPAIRVLAKVLKSGTPEDVLFDRYGERAMLCLCPGHTLAEGARIALEIHRQFHCQMQEQSRWDTLVLAGGLAEFPQHGTSRAEILRHAEEALYIAVSSGGDSIRVPPEETACSLSIELSGIQIKRLQQYADRQEVPMNELIREAIDEFLRGDLADS